MNYNNKEDFEVCRAYMTSDEYVLWKGKPQNFKRITPENYPHLAFGIFWLGFSLFWCFGASKAGGGVVALFGLPFVAIGVYLCIGSHIQIINQKKKTYYVITNQKIIRVRANRVDTIDGRNLPQINIKGFKDGTGNIYFGEQIVITRNGKNRKGYSGGSFALENVPIFEVQNALNAMINENQQKD